MKWLQALKLKAPKHKYAIDSNILGDEADLAWSNLGYWKAATRSYPQACIDLADHLAKSIHLNSKDRLLDLGCGQGASLLLWKNKYNIQNVAAIELQPECIERIQQHLPDISELYCQSFLNLNQIKFKNHFDVIVCIDAAYHTQLSSLLSAITPILKSNGRVAFHTLMRTDAFEQLNSFQKAKYLYLLKCADVQLTDVMPRGEIVACLNHYGYENVDVEDLSEPVLYGFSNYSMNKIHNKSFKGIAGFKIAMTAKLCITLYKSGLIRYVQVSAKRADGIKMMFDKK